MGKLTATIHPRPNDAGEQVIIQKPTPPTPLENWHNPKAVATVAAGGPMPAELNGIPFKAWNDYPRTTAEWNGYQGLMPDLVEAAMQVPVGKKASAGVIVLEPDGRVWTVHPSNGFGGYFCTFAKGRVEDGMSLQATAAREALEESGLKVRIVGLLGDFMRTTTVTRLYLAERTGGTPALMGWESQACTLAPLDALPGLLNGAADKPVLTALQLALSAAKDSLGDVLQEGGNLVRTLQAIDGFFAVHGAWPTDLQMHPECLIDLVTRHLTPTGFYRLHSKVRLRVSHDMNLVASDTHGRTFDYGEHGFDVTNTGMPARRWLEL